MMTILFPAMLPVADYQKLMRKNQKLGEHLRRVLDYKIPVGMRWYYIRTREYLRRRSLRRLSGMDNVPDAFVFHGYSRHVEPFRLLVEIYDDHTPVFKFSLLLTPGENLHVLNGEKLAPACWKNNFLLKVYPENDIEADLDILWCDFVKGRRVESCVPDAKVKCVVWDLDNTLWDGTLIEAEDSGKLRLLPGVMDTIRELDARGIVQSVASKNEFESAMPVLRRLGLEEYFLYPQINWGAKSGSIRVIASKLNIGMDSFALIDDSVFEREQVRSVLPQVRVFDEKDVPGLLSREEFAVPVTEESRNRRMMYQAERSRNELQSENDLDTVEFIKRCNLQIEVFTPETQKETERCFELVARTNQLNMTGVKYSKDEFAAVLRRPGHCNVAFSCRDDFGAYGIVCFCQYTKSSGEVVVTEFAMSCRVAGKFVESAFFAFLLRHAGLGRGIFEVKKTAKNILLRKSLEKIGFVPVSEDETRIKFSFSGNLLEKDLVKIHDNIVP